VASPNFIDYVTLYVRSGKGGAGAAHFRRERFVPKGGPDGGDGGRGGHIILRGNQQLATLLHLKYQKHVKAGHGRPGEGNQRTGAAGQDVVLEVPLGTVVKDADTGNREVEITEQGQTHILISGGRGGLGNIHFKSATQQAPRFAQPGEPSREEWITLELKLLADVGLVGLPNAGKSTLLSVLSAAKPVIADYPFTTLTPNLGIVAYRNHQAFVMADIPGLIEGAATGRGLGTRFLRHIERSAVLLFVIAADDLNVPQTYNMLRRELAQHNPELLAKQYLLAISKTDLLDEDLRLAIEKNLPPVEHVFISSYAREGLTLLKDKLWQMLKKER